MFQMSETTFVQARLKSGDDPAKFFMEIDKIIMVLASLGVHKDEEFVEYHHERWAMRTVVNNVTHSHIETVARRRFADLSLEAKGPVNHRQALVADGSDHEGGSGKSRGGKLNSSSNGDTGDSNKGTRAGSAGPSSRKERRTSFRCDQPGHIKENCTAYFILSPL